MADRVRPSGTVNVPTQAEIADAHEAVTESLRHLAVAADAIVSRLSQVANPIERAKAVMAVRKYTSTDLTGLTDGLFRDSILEAYARGRTEHGWYGYGAIAEELGISRARVQQVVNGSWKGAPKDTAKVDSLRESADRARTVRRLARAGHPPEEIAETTGLALPAIYDLLD